MNSSNTLLAAAKRRHQAKAEAFERALQALPANASARNIQAVDSVYRRDLDKLEAEMRKLEAEAPILQPRITVTEAPTYHRDNPERSWIADMYAARTMGDTASLERLRRNGREAILDAERRGMKLRDREGRALNSSSTTGGDFLPPIWAGEYYAEVKRARRVVSRLMHSIPLPPSGETITIPRMTSGTTTAAQQDNQNVSNTDPATAPLTVPVCSVAGYTDLSRLQAELELRRRRLGLRA